MYVVVFFRISWFGECLGVELVLWCLFIIYVLFILSFLYHIPVEQY